MLKLEGYEKVNDRRGNTIFVLHLFSDNCDSADTALKFCRDFAAKYENVRYSYTLVWNISYAELIPYTEKRNYLWDTVVGYFSWTMPGIAAILTNADTKHKITEEGLLIEAPYGLYNVLCHEKLAEKIGLFLNKLFSKDTAGNVFGAGSKEKVVIKEKAEEKATEKVSAGKTDANSIAIDFNEEDYAKAMQESIERNKKNKNSSGKGGKTQYAGANHFQRAGATDGDTYKGAGDDKKKGRRRLTPGEGEELKKDRNGNTILIGGEIISEPVSLSRIDSDSGYVAVHGNVLTLEKKKIPSGSYVATFALADNTGSVFCKFFFDPEDEEFVNKYFSVGKGLTVYGDVTCDKYTHITTLSVRNAATYSPKVRMDDAETKRVELHLHTCLSQLDAITRPKDLMARLHKWGHTAIAITDHGVVQGYPEIFNAAKAIYGGKTPINEMIKIIYGMECYLTDQPGKVTKEEARSIPSWHCIILVKNLVGLKNLYRLITKSNLEYFYKKPRIPRFELEKYREGLIIGSACSEGELYHALAHGASDEELLKMASFYDYLEIQPVGNNRYLLREGVVGSENELRRLNEKIVKIGDELGKMTVATCDVHFLDPEDAIYRSVMQAGQGYKDFEDQPPIYLRTTGEMLAEFDYLGDRAYEVVVENTNKIADMVEYIRPVPDGNFPPSIEGSDEQFREISMETAKKLYGDPIPEFVLERLERELNCIISNGYSVMYMAAQKLVAHSAENGYTVGSRGSVGSSVAAFMSGITEVNALPPHYRCPDCYYQEWFYNQEYEAGCDMPPKDCPNCKKPLIRDGFDIPFETFLGFKGDKVPDIDLNFATKDQPSAHKYCGVMFGDDHVFRAGTISGLAEKTARGYVLKYLEATGKPATEAEIVRLASGFQGVKRTTGQHPGGIMVVPADMEILDFTAIQHPADDADSETITTHFDYHFLHDNILKLDILGHDGPEIIKCLQDFTGITMDKIDIADEKVLSLFTSADALNLDKSILPIEIEVGTLGIPEFGTHFAIGLLKDTHPTKVSELVRISGLSHGTNVWQDNTDQIIKKGIAPLSECICCRDDIMLYLIKMGLEKLTAFKIMESVRKGKVAKKGEPNWPEWKAAMKEHNVPDWYIESCEKIEYMFPRAHAVAYVMLSLRMAWFKVYQPLAYYATRFTLKVDDFDGVKMLHGIEKARMAMLEVERLPEKSAKNDDQLTIYEQLMEMYARHIEFLPVDLYKSEADRFVPEGDKLRPPFCSLAGVGKNAALAIVDARNRKEGEFECIDDVVEMAGLNKTVREILKSEGVFGDLPDNNDLTLF